MRLRLQGDDTMQSLGPEQLPVWSTKAHGPHSYSRGRFCVILEQLLRFLCLPYPEWHWAPGNKDSRWMSAGRRVRSSCFVPSLLPIKGAITTNPHWATYDLCYLENKNMKTLETCYKCCSWSPCQETPYNGDYCSTRSIQRTNLLKGLRQTHFRKNCSKEKLNKDSSKPVFLFWGCS